MRRPVGKGRDAACLSCPAASSGWPSPRALASDAPFCWQMSRRVMRMAGIKVVLKESAQELKRRVIVVSHSTERQSKPARVQDKARQAGSRQPQKIAKQVSLSL